MTNYKITIAYDGGRYHGWQSQRHTDQTIEQKITELLCRFTGEEISLNGSGRTDAGVHAKGQVANFKTTKDWQEEALLEAFFAYLPQDIAVLSVEKVPEKFHARLSAVSKRYRYVIYNSPVIDVFERNYAWQVKDPLDITSMKRAASILCGEWDYKSFCANRRMKKSTVRTVYDIAITDETVPFGEKLTIEYTGNGFLYNMVRILTGTLVEVGKGQRIPEDMKMILEGKNRSLAGMTAPPMGLFLWDVQYDDAMIRHKKK